MLYLNDSFVFAGDLDVISLSLLPMLVTPSTVAKRGPLSAKRYTQLSTYYAFFPNFSVILIFYDLYHTNLV